ncbi:MAG: hypothetical protein V7785_06450 [Bermanella sp.]
MLFVGLLVIWQLMRVINEEATLEEARTTGLKEAGAHIQSPVLLEDYADATGISKKDLELMVERKEIPSYSWRQYTYIENRELINRGK